MIELNPSSPLRFLLLNSSVYPFLRILRCISIRFSVNVNIASLFSSSSAIDSCISNFFSLSFNSCNCSFNLTRVYCRNLFSKPFFNDDYCVSHFTCAGSFWFIYILFFEFSNRSCDYYSRGNLLLGSFINKKISLFKIVSRRSV